MRLQPVILWSVGLGLGLGAALGAGLVAYGAPREALTDAAIVDRARALGMRPLTELAGAEVTLTVGPGTTPAQLADALKEAGLLNDREGFLAAAGSKSPAPRVYRLRAGESVSALVGRFFP
jgi:hypothetical protein